MVVKYIIEDPKRLAERTLLHAVDAILSAKHVFMIGFGSSAPVVQDAYQRFLKLQVSSPICSDAHALTSIIFEHACLRFALLHLLEWR
jgi:DNA-binding MurR/RpiR family transcriptional regulator